MRMFNSELLIKGIQECDLNGGLFGNCPYKEIVSMLQASEARYIALLMDYNEFCDEVLKRLKNLEKELG